MRLKSLFLMTSTAMLLASQAEADDFCARFMNVYSDADVDFHDLRGVSDPHFYSTEPLTSFPKADYCDIDDTIQHRYVCSWHYAINERDEAFAAVRTLVSAIRGCLDISGTPDAPNTTVINHGTDSRIWRDTLSVTSHDPLVEIDVVDRAARTYKPAEYGIVLSIYATPLK